MDATASFETQRTLPGPWSYWQNACPCVCRSCVPAFLIVEYRNHCENLRPYAWLCHLAFFIDSSLCTVSRSAGKYFTFITFLKILGFFFFFKDHLNWPVLSRINSFLMHTEPTDKGPLSYPRNLCTSVI